MPLIIIPVNAERLHQLDCPYNFMWIHCDDIGPICEGGNVNCFCNASLSNGVHVLHGNMGSFTFRETFLTDAYKGFQKVKATAITKNSIRLE